MLVSSACRVRSNTRISIRFRIGFNFNFAGQSSASRSKGIFQRAETAVVLLRRANGDPDPLRQLITGHRANDDAEFLHFLEYTLAVADADQNEVGVRRDEFQTELMKRALENVEARHVIGTRAGQMLPVVQGSERAGLRNRVDVKR